MFAHLEHAFAYGFHVAQVAKLDLAQSLDEALAGKDSVAEGVLNAQSAKALADRAGVEMPIIDATYRILFEGQAPREAVAELMARELRAERD